MSELDAAREAKASKKASRAISMAIAVLENMFSRQDLVVDPAARHLMFLEKLCLTLDVGLASMAMLPDTISPDVKERANKMGQKLQQHLEDLVRWVQAPAYGPDHPYGKQQISIIANDFTDGVNVQDTEKNKTGEEDKL